MTTIGVKLSGGADSSIIYYMLCDKYKNNPKSRYCCNYIRH